jgi:hypothetical protein
MFREDSCSKFDWLSELEDESENDKSPTYHCVESLETVHGSCQLCLIKRRYTTKNEQIQRYEPQKV